MSGQVNPSLMEQQQQVVDKNKGIVIQEGELPDEVMSGLSDFFDTHFAAANRNIFQKRTYRRIQIQDGYEFSFQLKLDQVDDPSRVLDTKVQFGKQGDVLYFANLDQKDKIQMNLCSRVTSALHFKMKLVVGTSITCPAYVLNAYLPGSSGLNQTPCDPLSTNSPWRYSSPEMSFPCLPV